MKLRSILVFVFAWALIALPATVHATDAQPSSRDASGTLDTASDGHDGGYAAAGAAETVEQSAEGAAGTVVGTTKDAYLVTNVKSKLAASDETSASEIEVDSNDGVITLSGTVPSEDAKSAAEEIAGDVDGVSSVKNDLRVSGTATEEAD